MKDLIKKLSLIILSKKHENLDKDMLDGLKKLLKSVLNENESN